MNKARYVVHKFGGTSVGSAERYRKVAEIVAAPSGGNEPCAIVVSAIKTPSGGVTDGLIALVQDAAKQNSAYRENLKTLHALHRRTADELLKEAAGREALHRVFEKDFGEIEEILRGVWLARTASEPVVELVSGFGEVWSAQLLNAHLNERGMASRWLDARQVLVVEPREFSVQVDWKRSQELTGRWMSENPKTYTVITGFVASTADGVATTLKRNGSDYSAAIFGALLEASEVVIWTDVDGVLSADPRLVPDAVVLPEMSYEEVAELAYFGAKVVHPATMQPAIRAGIPIWIKNSFNPGAPGTKIHRHAKSKTVVQGFSTIDGMILINVEGNGMVGVPGVSERLFGALRSAGVSVVMISQASSEHSICFAVPKNHASIARKALESAFVGELAQGLIQSIVATEDCSILAVVGDQMAHHPGVAGKFFSALGRSGVNIRAIAQGSSERNISAVIASDQAERALRAVHSAFYLSPQTISLAMVGTGLIAKSFLAQLEKQGELLRRDRIDIRLRGIANSKRMLIGDEKGIPLARWKDLFEEKAVPLDLGRWEDQVAATHLPHTVVIDATASEEIPRRYPRWFDRGFHVVTPNKKGNSSDLQFYREIRERARARGRSFHYSTNVGAGLPILRTLRDLVRTGDRIISIEGILSGTLSFLFNSFDGSRPFSEIVREARELGYTEPDPRDDLSGKDVARKLVILAREAGWPMELASVDLESLVPGTLREGGVEEYLRGLPADDSRMNETLKQAQAQGEVLRYVGSIDEQGRAAVKLRGYPKTHAFARLSGSDNIVLFRTERYNRQCLIVQGPGAGPEVTAAGVFADLLRLVSEVGGET